MQILAQQRNANWLNAGVWMEFESGAPVLAPTPPQVGVGASLSDTTGQLRVYVTSATANGGLKGPDHQLADNHPDPSILVSGDWIGRSLFVPKPGQPDHAFFIYNQTYFPGGGEVNRVGWLELDLSADHPVVVNNDFTWFTTDATRKRFAVPHANGSDYWLVLQRMDINLFQAHAISASGVDPIPVLSQTGAWPPESWTFGMMTPNNQGDRFASVTGPGNYDWTDTTSAIAEVFHFDQATGEVSLELALPGLRRVKGVEFSPNGRFLYVAELHTPPGAYEPASRRLYQYDMEATDPIASRLLIHSHSFTSMNLPSINVLALAPDGRIYQAPDLYGTALGIIRRPDELGLACDYVHDSFSCQTVIYSLPSPVKCYHDDSLVVALAIGERTRTTALRAYPNPARENIRIQGPAFGAALANFRDAMGRVVLTSKYANGSFDISSLASGSYVVEVCDARGTRLGAARVMKE
ncbi:MAG: T9SS type A sorting domain-containing protein [Flavobacteriales bacterium]|nr:T9SS type A sorting domain-containing protein [Flavobacteriales bacterium]